MDDDTDDVYWAKLLTVWSRILIGVVILLVVMGTVGGWWMWQVSHNQIVIIDTPMSISRHPSAVSPFKTLTARALSAGPPARASVTPPVVTATPTTTH